MVWSSRHICRPLSTWLMTYLCQPSLKREMEVFNSSFWGVRNSLLPSGGRRPNDDKTRSCRIMLFTLCWWYCHSNDNNRLSESCLLTPVLRRWLHIAVANCLHKIALVSLSCNWDWCEAPVLRAVKLSKILPIIWYNFIAAIMYHSGSANWPH